MSDFPTSPTSLLIDQIYAAALGDVAWSVPLEGLREQTRSRFVALMSVHPGSAIPAVDGLVSDDAANMQSLLLGYTGHFHQHDPTPDFVENWPARRWFLDRQAMSERERSRDVYYQDFLKPHGADNWSGLFLARGGQQSSFLSFVGARGDALDEAARHGVDRVSEHFARALQIGRRLGQVAQDGAMAATLLDAVPDPLYLLDEEGRLLVDNAAGRALAAQQPQLLNFSQGRFAPRVAGWQRAMWQAACKTGLLVLRKTDGTPLHLFLTPVPAHAGLARHWQRPLMLLSAAMAGNAELKIQRLRVLYGLTRTEAALAVEMACDGHSPAACAQSRGVAISTVRSQIKSIQIKMGVTRLALVVGKVLSL